MAGDLSSFVPGLVPSSEAATNTISSSAAMSAPGTMSETTAHEQAGNPETSERDADRSGRTHLVHGEHGGEVSHTWDDVSGQPLDWGP